MTALPPTYYLHVWWARWPLVASRAAVLASLLPADADRERFLHVLGIHGDPVATRRRIDAAKRNGQNLGLNPYGYRRAFTYSPSAGDIEWIDTVAGIASAGSKILDPTAGGGSIPIEIGRLGLSAHANDLNPVATLILRATADWPTQHGSRLLAEFNNLASEFVRRAEPKYRDISRGATRQAVLRATSGRALSLAIIARASCRCRRTGGWRRMEQESG